MGNATTTAAPANPTDEEPQTPKAPKAGRTTTTTAATGGTQTHELLVTGVSASSALGGKVTAFRDRIRAFDGVSDLLPTLSRVGAVAADCEGADGAGAKNAGQSGDPNSDHKRTVLLVVYDVVKDAEREVEVCLPDTLGKIGVGENKEGGEQIDVLADLLGVAYEVVRVGEGGARILRVTQVVENSPAEDASLEAGSDFVLYSLSFKYHDLKSFCDQVKEVCKQPIKSPDGVQANRKIKLAIYSLAYDQVRVVTISPYERWSPINGWLGAQFGAGTIDDFRTIQKQGIDKPAPRREKDVAHTIPKPETNPITHKLEAPSPKKPEPRFLSVERVPQLPSITFMPLNRRLATKQVNLFGEVGILFEDMETQQTYRITKEDLILLDRDFPDCKFGGAPKLTLVGSKPSAGFDGLEQLTRENTRQVGAFTISVNSRSPTTITM